MSKNRVFVIGVGMTKFEKPGRREDWDYPAMAKEAGSKALEDAGISFDAVEQAHVGYVYGDSTSGQRAVYELGMTGIPITNVNNNCSTGSTALFLAAQSVRGGLAECALALGFEKMQPGSLQGGYADREQPLGRHIQAEAELFEFAFPPAPWMFGAAGVEHMQRYGTTTEQFAKVGEKNHRHWGQFRRRHCSRCPRAVRAPVVGARRYRRNSPEGTAALDVVHAIGDALADEVGQLLDQVGILQQDGAVPATVSEYSSLPTGQHGFLPNRRLVLVTTPLACNARSVRKRSALGPAAGCYPPGPRCAITPSRRRRHRFNCGEPSPAGRRTKGFAMTDDKKPNSGHLLGQGEPGHPAVGRGPNAGGEYSQEDYHHPAAGWGAARSVAKVLAQSRELVAGTRAIQLMNHENGGLRLPGMCMAG